METIEIPTDDELEEPAPVPTPLDALLTQAEQLRSLRGAAIDQSMALIDLLRAEVAGTCERERSTAAKMRASERREAAAVAESEKLRKELAKEKADAAAALRRSAWEIRKREEAAVAAASAASASAAAADERASAEFAQVRAQLKQRERELQLAQAQVKALRHLQQEEALREKQVSFLDQRGGGSNEQRQQQQQQQYRNPSNFVSDYFDFTTQSLKALDEHSDASTHDLKSGVTSAPQHPPSIPMTSSGPVSVVAIGNPPVPEAPPNHLPRSGTSSSSFPSALTVSTVGSFSTTDGAVQQEKSAEPIIISKTEGIKYGTHVNSTTLPPPHIMKSASSDALDPLDNSSIDNNNNNSASNNPAEPVAPPLESLYRPRIITVGGKEPEYVSPQNDLNPQEWLDRRFEERGYSTENFSSLECAYYNKPTEFQQASYGLKVVNMCRTNDVEGLAEIMECGLSYNPCNQFGESLIHMACRRGNYPMLKYLVDRGCSVQICDDFGRTPLHDACWTSEPNFKIVELILDTDTRLLHIVDCRGATPLAYVKRENWQKWKEVRDGCTAASF